MRLPFVLLVPRALQTVVNFDSTFHSTLLHSVYDIRNTYMRILEQSECVLILSLTFAQYK